MTENIPTKPEELTPAELEHVAAGTRGILVALGDGSVRTVDASDLAVWQEQFGAGG